MNQKIVSRKVQTNFVTLSYTQLKWEEKTWGDGRRSHEKLIQYKSKTPM